MRFSTLETINDISESAKGKDSKAALQIINSPLVEKYSKYARHFIHSNKSMLYCQVPNIIRSDWLRDHPEFFDDTKGCKSLNWVACCFKGLPVVGHDKSKALGSRGRWVMVYSLPEYFEVSKREFDREFDLKNNR